MTDSWDDGNLQTLWQSQTLDRHAISLDEIRRKANHFERLTTRRNLREYVGAVVIVAGFGWIMWSESSGIIRAGGSMVIAGTLFIVYRLRTRAAWSPVPMDLGLKNALEFYLEELARQRDLLRTVWLWYLLPIVPGMLVAQIGRALEHPDRLKGIVLYCASMLAGAVVLHVLNRLGATRIQQRIDRLTQFRR